MCSVMNGMNGARAVTRMNRTWQSVLSAILVSSALTGVFQSFAVESNVPVGEIVDDREQSRDYGVEAVAWASD